MTKIPTWNERCEVHPDHQSGMVTNAMIQKRMQEKIDDLRAEVARLREALDKIAQHPTGGIGCNPVVFVEEARAALAEQEKK